jgi:cbb3-type cytochrome oxidase maturation protein
VIGVVFWFALQGGQFDDLDGPAHAVLDNDEGFDPGQIRRRDGQ